MPMMLRSGRLTGTRGILLGHSVPVGKTLPQILTASLGRWSMYIKPSEQKEAQSMLRGEIPILLDPREMINWMKDPNKDNRPSPQDSALARTMCIASGGKTRMRVSASRAPQYYQYLEQSFRQTFHTTAMPAIPISPHWISLSLH